MDTTTNADNAGMHGECDDTGAWDDAGVHNKCDDIDTHDELDENRNNDDSEELFSRVASKMTGRVFDWKSGLKNRVANEAECLELEAMLGEITSHSEYDYLRRVITGLATAAYKSRRVERSECDRAFIEYLKVSGQLHMSFCATRDVLVKTLGLRDYCYLQWNRKDGKYTVEVLKKIPTKFSREDERGARGGTDRPQRSGRARGDAGRSRNTRPRNNNARETRPRSTPTSPITILKPKKQETATSPPITSWADELND